MSDLAADVVQDLARRLGVERPEVVRDELRWTCSADAREQVIRLGRQFETMPDAAQRWVVAHEFAHIVSKHEQPRPLAVLTSVAASMAVSAGVISLPIVAGASVETVPFLAIALAVLIARSFRFYRIRRERVADRLATEWGYPLGAGEAREWALNQPELGLVPQQMCSVHDTWARRVRDSQGRLTASAGSRHTYRWSRPRHGQVANAGDGDPPCR